MSTRYLPILATLRNGRTVLLGAPDGDAAALGRLIATNGLVSAIEVADLTMTPRPGSRTVRELVVYGGDVADLAVVSPGPEYEVIFRAAGAGLLTLALAGELAEAVGSIELRLSGKRLQP